MAPDSRITPISPIQETEIPQSTTTIKQKQHNKLHTTKKDKYEIASLYQALKPVAAKRKAQ